MQRNLQLLVVCAFVWSIATFLSPLAFAQNKAPKTPTVPEQLDPAIETHQSGVRMTLLAEHPALVTPTGIDVDEQGRIWLISCHTHFRPEGYPGPEHDEVLVFDKDGKNHRVFYNKTDATMHVKLGNDGWVYLAERDRILRVKDTDGDGVGDLEENVAVLDSVADYPHNGLSGMAWHPNGGLVFSLGENFGKDWTLTARDGSKVSGRGEGGVFWAKADGSQMRRIARGFWNPFGLMVRADGEIFAAENDPGSRPPCRLLQIIEGADYGYQWVYGSAPVHPFVAWNGELRGTLGMIHPSGEGPSAIVQLGGGVLIPSWSNHAIEYFPLQRQGAGYTSQRVEVLSGSEYFRPVGMAVGPTAQSSYEYFVTDWVYSSYELHQRGRLWKLEIDKSAAWVKAAVEPLNAETKLAQQLRSGQSKADLKQLIELARSKDAYMSDAALTAMAKASADWTPETLLKMSPEDRLWALVALRRVDLKEEKWVRALWQDKDQAVRFEVLRWIADGELVSFKDEVEQLLKSSDIDYTLFEAALATWNTLNGNPGAGVTDPEVLAARVSDPATPAKIKSYALRLAPADHKKIDLPLLRQLFATGDRDLQVEVVRTLGAKKSADASSMLTELIRDASLDAEMRADAISGLGLVSKLEQVSLLQTLASDSNRSIRHAALRGLRGAPIEGLQRDKLKSIAQQFPESAELVSVALDPAFLRSGRPQLSDTVAWLNRIQDAAGPSDAEAGRRIFHAAFGQCANCHRHSGRGNVVGPDLSLVARQGDRANILRSLLEPNRDVAPQYFATALELADGNVFTGILLRSSSVDVYRDATGKERVFQKADVVQRKELKSSMMPTGLVDQLSDQDLRDLLDFLTASK